MLTAILIGVGVFLAALAVLAGLSASFSISLTHGQDNVSATVTITGDSKDYGEITLAAADDTDVIIAIDPDAIKAYSFVSDVACTLTTTNTGGSPDSVAMVAGEPIFWNEKMVWTNGHFVNRAPWTKLTFTVAGATAGTLTYLIIRDGTP